jgi:ATP-dependent protease HslVU (ClpYQ) peptidase subunit
MTIIVGYRPEGGDRVWLGADSRVSGEGFIFPERRRKLHRIGDWLVGCCGSGRWDEFFDTDAEFGDIRALRDGFLAYVKGLGAEPEDNNKGHPPAWGVTLTAARRGELWLVSSNGALVRSAWGFVACGSGQDFAYGAAAVAHRVGLRACEIVRHSIEAAILFRTDCGGEIDIESVG